MIVLKQIISGGQTGADIGGLMAAEELKLKTGGWIPRNFKNELGDGQFWLRKYDLREHKDATYPPRTKQNILDSDGTVIFATIPLETGSKFTWDCAQHIHKPNMVINTFNIHDDITRDFLIWLEVNKIVILNVAGNRESKSPGIQLRVKNFLVNTLVNKLI